MATLQERLAGAFRNIGHITAADEIINTMKSLGYDIREEDITDFTTFLASLMKV